MPRKAIFTSRLAARLDLAFCSSNVARYDVSAKKKREPGLPK
jgi:hypothetical protein